MLRVAQSIDQRGPLDLTDEFVEHSSVIKAILDILYDQEITSFRDDKLYHHVIEFARKYDMSSNQDHLEPTSGTCNFAGQSALLTITTNRNRSG
jgi:hypothetical protein